MRDADGCWPRVCRHGLEKRRTGTWSGVCVPCVVFRARKRRRASSRSGGTVAAWVAARGTARDVGAEERFATDVLDARESKTSDERHGHRRCRTSLRHEHTDGVGAVYYRYRDVKNDSSGHGGGGSGHRHRAHRHRPAQRSGFLEFCISGFCAVRRVFCNNFSRESRLSRRSALAAPAPSGPGLGVCTSPSALRCAALRCDPLSCVPLWASPVAHTVGCGHGSVPAPRPAALAVGSGLATRVASARPCCAHVCCASRSLRDLALGLVVAETTAL